MSQTRKHLNSDRTGTHGGFPSFVMQCHHCKQEFVERHSCVDYTAANASTFQSQQRGDTILPVEDNTLHLP
jgi:hypothetical protein